MKTKWPSWGVLVGLQVASWVVHGAGRLTAGSWTAETVLRLVSIFVAFWVAIAYGFKWRPLTVAVIVLVGGQWNLVLREATLLVSRYRGFAP